MRPGKKYLLIGLYRWFKFFIDELLSNQVALILNGLKYLSLSPVSIFPSHLVITIVISWRAIFIGKGEETKPFKIAIVEKSSICPLHTHEWFYRC